MSQTSRAGLRLVKGSIFILRATEVCRRVGGKDLTEDF